MDCKELNNRLTEHYAERRKLRTDVCEAIYDMVTEMGGTVRTVTDEYEDYVSICYDGGNHVEYASTMCCDMYSVTAVVVKAENDLFEKVDRKTFTVECEQEDELDEWRMIFDDVTEIFDFVCRRYDDFKKQSEE